jgi:hypothetical protein
VQQQDQSAEVKRLRRKHLSWTFPAHAFSRSSVKSPSNGIQFFLSEFAQICAF